MDSPGLSRLMRRLRREHTIAASGVQPSSGKPERKKSERKKSERKKNTLKKRRATKTDKTDKERQADVKKRRADHLAVRRKAARSWLSFGPPHLYLGEPVLPEDEEPPREDAFTTKPTPEDADLDTLLHVIRDPIHRDAVIRNLVAPSPKTVLGSMRMASSPTTVSELDAFLTEEFEILSYSDLWREAEADQQLREEEAARLPKGSSPGLVGTGPLSVPSSAPTGAILSLPTRMGTSRCINIQYNYVPAILLPAGRFKLQSGKAGLVMDGVAFLAERHCHVPLGRILPLSGDSSIYIMSLVK